MIENHTLFPMFNKSIQKPQIRELSRLCPQTSTKFYVHEFVFFSQFCTLILLSFVQILPSIRDLTFLFGFFSSFFVIQVLDYESMTTKIYPCLDEYMCFGTDSL
jgi:hypothetical protein